METKDTNPKDAVGIRKAPMSCVPAQVLLELGLAMMEGARKYGKFNYRVAGVRASVYYDAALRHLMAWHEGEDIDADSGISHLTKAMACLCVIRDATFRNHFVDDRPPSLPNGWQVDLNKKASDLIDRLPESKTAYTKRIVDDLQRKADADVWKLAENTTGAAPAYQGPTCCATAGPIVTPQEYPSAVQSVQYFDWVSGQKTEERET